MYQRPQGRTPCFRQLLSSELPRPAPPKIIRPVRLESRDAAPRLANLPDTPTYGGMSLPLPDPAAFEPDPYSDRVIKAFETVGPAVAHIAVHGRNGRTGI